MKLKTFLESRQKNEPFDAPVIYLQGGTVCPALFCSSLMARLKEQGVPVKVVDSMETSWQDIQGMLSTTFLGQTEVFWLGDLSVLEATLKKKILQFLASYEAPHTVFCFVTDKEISSKVERVDLASPLDKDDIEAIFQFLWQTSATPFFTMIPSDYKTLSLDNLLLLGFYSRLLGAKSRDFMESWYGRIVVPEASLFTLSQSFFSRKKESFFRLWLTVKDEYAAPFWTTFWSEQLWRAYYVIKLRKNGKFHEAQQMGFRLPFSFLQKEWQSISTQELKNAHNFLYQVDCDLKSGGSMLSLELFYDSFLQKKF